MLTIEEGIEAPRQKNTSRDIRDTLDVLPQGKHFRIPKQYRAFVGKYAREKGYKIVTAVAKDSLDEVRVWRIA